MRFVINKDQLDTSPEGFARQAGYAYIRNRHTGQDSFVRELARGGYPRFHIHFNHMGQNVVLDLHLDQKRPRYRGAKAHNAEYGGEVLQKEMERLKEIIIKNSNQAFLKKEEIKETKEKKKSWWQSLFE